jgi:hypothetical protein
MPGQTNSFLVLPKTTLADSGSYSVIASNTVGTATNTALLTVRPKPDLRITEVQSAEAASPGVPTGDWWELTSFEAAPVNLAGWRFNDSGGGLADPFVLTNSLTIAPGESIVFVENLTPAEFQNWWGATNLPAGLQIVSYHGSGLSFAATGDGVRLWNDVATDPADTIASADFGSSTPGLTFNYDPLSAAFGVQSRLGVNGVFQAASAPDIGSPGRILAPLAAPSLRLNVAAGQVQISFQASTGRRYSLESRSGLGPDSPWEPTGDSLQSTNNLTAVFEKPLGSVGRFYRVLAQ